MIVILDSGILGLLATLLKNTSESEDTEIFKCTQWFYSLLSKGVLIVTSEISDYEVRRELIRIKSEGITKLDSLKEWIYFQPIETEVLKRAAEFWAEARQNHIKTADDKNIDADMIIAAQWSLLKEEYPGRAVLIATTNLKHISIFAKFVLSVFLEKILRYLILL